MLVIVALIPAFPPLLVSSFIVPFSANPSTHYLCGALYFHFSLTVCNASYLLSPHLLHPPSASSSTSTPRKISFSLSRDGNETFIHFLDVFPPEVPLKLFFKGVLHSTLCGLTGPLNDNKLLKRAFGEEDTIQS